MLMTMFTFLAIITVIVWALLIVVAGFRPHPSLVSRAELERRAKRSEHTRVLLRRENLLPDVSTFLRLVSALLLVASILLSVVTYGWGIGVVIAIILALFYLPLATWRPLAALFMGLYEKLEPPLLDIVEKGEPVFRVLRETPLVDTEHFHRFDSREELAQLIERADDILNDHERQLVTHALLFADKTVDSIMTPRSTIDSIKRGEFLGPLVLDELHALGHSRLPVIDKDLNHVVGILYLRDLLSLDHKDSATAEKIMEKKVYYIRHDDTLEHALAAFLKTRHHLFIVINGERETVGLVTLEDVIEALIGRRIVDEDDIHADLRAVAASRKTDNNTPSGRVDV